MREIKFRIWDQTKKRMVNDALVVTDLRMDFDVPQAKEGVLWMQFTGLKDRNGKEIYEGDICRIHDFEPEVVEIAYRQEVAAFEGLAPDDGTFKNRHVELRGDYYEVIGNIHENPELVK